MRSGPAGAIGTVVFLGALLVAGCDRGGRAPGSEEVPRQAEDENDDVPLTGGACTYEEISFRAAVDSVLADGALLVRAHSVPSSIDWCGTVSEVGPDRWRVPAVVGADPPAPEDSVEVSGEVIVSGTCTPCSISSRLLPGGA